jgi:hypothetical protein
MTVNIDERKLGALGLVLLCDQRGFGIVFLDGGNRL